MTRMTPCTECSRHVFVSESSCPFCGASLAARPAALRYGITSGMSRAQRLALVAAVAGQAALASCYSSEDSTMGPGPAPGGTAAGSPAVDVAGSGASGAAQGGAGDDGTGGSQPGFPQAMYGGGLAPPAGNGGRGGTGDEFSVPVYGAPMFDAGTPRDDDDAGTG